MLIIPAVDVLDGKCVQLIGGDVRKKRVEMGDPVQVAKDIEAKGARYLHIVDLDAALSSGKNTDQVLEMIKGLSIPVQIGGGIRSHLSIDFFLRNRADRVVVGTKAVLEVDWLERMAKSHPNKIVVALDTRGEEIQIKGWKASSGRNLIDFAKEIDDFKLAAFLFTNVVLEGRMVGTDVKIVKKLMGAVKTQVIAAGGVTTMRDLKALDDLGVPAVVIGSAIYEGKLDLSEAIRRFS